MKTCACLFIYEHHVLFHGVPDEAEANMVTRRLGPGKVTKSKLFPVAACSWGAGGTAASLNIEDVRFDTISKLIADAKAKLGGAKEIRSVACNATAWRVSADTGYVLFHRSGKTKRVQRIEMRCIAPACQRRVGRISTLLDSGLACVLRDRRSCAVQWAPVRVSFSLRGRGRGRLVRLRGRCEVSRGKVRELKPTRSPPTTARRSAWRRSAAMVTSGWQRAVTTRAAMTAPPRTASRCPHSSRRPSRPSYRPTREGRGRIPVLSRGMSCPPSVVSRWLTSWLTGCLVACGATPSTPVDVPEPAPAGHSHSGSCKQSGDSDKPLIVEWPGAERAAMEAGVQRGTVVVRYDGCEMTLLSYCQAPGSYSYTGVTPKDENVVIRNADELCAKVPLGAAKLEAELSTAGQLELAMRMVGRYDSAERSLSSGQLKGACDGATHYVSGITVGAFELASGARAKIGGGTEVLGVGAGARSEAERNTLSRDGELAACTSARDSLPPDGCAALLRVEVLPLGATSGSSAPPPAVAPEQKLLDDCRDNAERRTKEAFDLCMQLVREYPKSPLVPEAMFVGARHLENKGQSAKAAALYRRLLRGAPRRARVASARFAELLQLIGDQRLLDLVAFDHILRHGHAWIELNRRIVHRGLTNSLLDLLAWVLVVEVRDRHQHPSPGDEAVAATSRAIDDDGLEHRLCIAEHAL